MVPDLQLCSEPSGAHRAVLFDIMYLLGCVRGAFISTATFYFERRHSGWWGLQQVAGMGLTAGGTKLAQGSPTVRTFCTHPSRVQDPSETAMSSPNSESCSMNSLARQRMPVSAGAGFVYLYWHLFNVVKAIP